MDKDKERLHASLKIKDVFSADWKTLIPFSLCQMLKLNCNHVFFISSPLKVFVTNSYPKKNIGIFS